MLYGVGFLQFGDQLSFDDMSEVCVSSFELTEQLKTKTYQYFNSSKQLMLDAGQSVVPESKSYKLMLEFQEFDFSVFELINGAAAESEVKLTAPVYTTGNQTYEFTENNTLYFYNATTSSPMEQSTPGNNGRNTFNFDTTTVVSFNAFSTDVIIVIEEADSLVAAIEHNPQKYRSFSGVIYSDKGTHLLQISKMQQLDYLSLSTNGKQKVSFEVLDRSIKIYRDASVV